MTDFETKIETLHQIRESEQFIDSVATTVEGTKPPNANGHTHIFIHWITSNVEHPFTDLADTLSWICLNATGLAVEAPKPAFPNDVSYWHSTRSKTSTLALFHKYVHMDNTKHSPHNLLVRQLSVFSWRLLALLQYGPSQKVITAHSNSHLQLLPSMLSGETPLLSGNA